MKKLSKTRHFRDPLVIGAMFLRTDETLQLRFNLPEKNINITGTDGADFFVCVPQVPLPPVT